jgi:teichuronic acid biosynthesis glycosyltransferase TuaC
MSRTVRSVLFSTLYPSAARPMHGLFVETRLRELLKTGSVEARVVAPVPWFPSTSPRFGDYARFARTPLREVRSGIDIQHPRYLLPPRIGMTLAPLLLALGARAALRRLRNDGFDFDVIDAHYYYPDGVAAALLGRHFSRPVVVTARGSDINLIADRALPRRMLQWADRNVRASIGVSAALVQRMLQLHFDPRHLHVMRNGVDLDRFRPSDRAFERRALGIDGEGPVILTVGNLHEHKGQGLAIEALAILRRRHADARLLVVGEGPDRDALLARSTALGLDGAVRLVGPVPNAELYRWYSAADLLVLASSREGWPNVLLESMACGTPVVATDVGGVREIVQGESAGQVARHRTPQSVADAMQDLLDTMPDHTAVRSYAQGFGWLSTSQAQLALFQTLFD